MLNLVDTIYISQSQNVDKVFKTKYTIVIYKNILVFENLHKYQGFFPSYIC